MVRSHAISLEELVKEEGTSQVSAYIKPGEANFQQVLNFVVAVKELYVLLEGDAKFKVEDLFITETPESEYDIHAGTEFSNTETTHETSIFPEYVNRQDVYQAVEIHAPSNLRQSIKQDIDKRWPTKHFENTFPYAATMSHLVNEYPLQSKR